MKQKFKDFILKLFVEAQQYPALVISSMLVGVLFGLCIPT